MNKKIRKMINEDLLGTLGGSLLGGGLGYLRQKATQKDYALPAHIDKEKFDQMNQMFSKDAPQHLKDKGAQLVAMTKGEDYLVPNPDGGAPKQITPSERDTAYAQELMDTHRQNQIDISNSLKDYGDYEKSHTLKGVGVGGVGGGVAGHLLSKKKKKKKEEESIEVESVVTRKQIIELYERRLNLCESKAEANKLNEALFALAPWAVTGLKALGGAALTLGAAYLGSYWGESEAQKNQSSSSSSSSSSNKNQSSSSSSSVKPPEKIDSKTKYQFQTDVEKKDSLDNVFFGK